jgi:hypothetical protein
MKLRKLGLFKNACACRSTWRLMHAKNQIADISPQNTRIKKEQTVRAVSHAPAYAWG